MQRGLRFINMQETLNIMLCVNEKRLMARLLSFVMNATHGVMLSYRQFPSIRIHIFTNTTRVIIYFDVIIFLNYVR